MTELKTPWQEFEQTAHCSVYQQYLWVKTYRDTITPQSKETHHFITLHDGEVLVAILPFALKNDHLCRTLTWLGNEHFNYFGGLYDHKFLDALTRQKFETLWVRIKQSLPKFDLLSLHNQLSYGTQNLAPFGWLNSSPSANLTHQLVYPHHDWSTLLSSLRGKKTRKRMRNEESRLGREGELSWKQLETKEEIDRYLPELLQQREGRLQALGVQANETRGEYLQLYGTMLTGALDIKDQPTRMIIIKLDEHLLAGIVLFKWRNSYYPLINSMTTSRYSSWSPGEFLLRIMMIQGCDEEIESVDYGLGEDGYKTAWCNQTTPIFDSLIPETLYGKVIASSIHQQQKLKRKIKLSPRLWELYRDLRKWRGKWDAAKPLRTKTR